MKQSFKRIISIVLLLVFILPASGMLLYVHHCSMSNATKISSTPESCCSGVACSLSNDVTSANETVIKKQPCCSDSQVFVKLGYHLFAQSIKVLTGDYFVINNGIQYNRLLTSNSFYSRIVFSDFTDPPIDSGYILFSSFRL